MKRKFYFNNPLFITSHLFLLLAFILWYYPPTQLLIQTIDNTVFLILNNSLVNAPFWQVFLGLLNHRKETKINLVFAFLFNVWAILATRDNTLRTQRIKQLLYFWLCFEIGFVLQDALFGHVLEVVRKSPSLVFTPVVKLSQILQTTELKEGTVHSFPSGHAFSLVYWASFSWLCSPQYIRPWVILLAILLCLPRLFIGAHWLSDELFSMLLAFVWLSWTIYNPLYNRLKSR